MGKVRMLDPSSGHDNFNAVSTQAAANASGGQAASQATNQNQDAAQATNKTEIEEKTKDAIKTAGASQSVASSNNSTTNEKK
jgi:hypothetical protein